MKQAKTALNLLAAASALLVISCGGPKEALSSYLDARNSGDYIKEWDYISASDKSVKDVQKFLVESVSGQKPLARAMALKTSHAVKSMKVEKVQAKAQVEMVAPDLEAVTRDVFGGNAAAADSQTMDQAAAMVKEAYKDKKLPMISRTEIYWLVKEQDGWKVWLNWKQEKQIEDLKALALELERAKDFTGAQSKYYEILQIAPDNKEATARIAELEQKMAGLTETQSYAGNVQVLSTSVEPTVGGAMAVFAEIKNQGDRTLGMVEIIISFLDEKENVIEEKSFRPVSVSKGSSGEGSKPFKPGQAMRFGVRADNLPPEWNKKVTIRISDLKFAD